MAGCGIYWDGGKETRGASGHLLAAQCEALPLIPCKKNHQRQGDASILGLGDEATSARVLRSSELLTVVNVMAIVSGSEEKPSTANRHL